MVLHFALVFARQTRAFGVLSAGPMDARCVRAGALRSMAPLTRRFGARMCVSEGMPMRSGGSFAEGMASSAPPSGADGLTRAKSAVDAARRVATNTRVLVPTGSAGADLNHAMPANLEALRGEAVEYDSTPLTGSGGADASRWVYAVETRCENAVSDMLADDGVADEGDDCDWGSLTGSAGADRLRKQR
jgi:hypothetical protein